MLKETMGNWETNVHWFFYHVQHHGAIKNPNMDSYYGTQGVTVLIDFLFFSPIVITRISDQSIGYIVIN